MPKYDEILIMKEKSDYSLEEKAEVFDKIWDIAKNYYDYYATHGGDNDDEEFDFRQELKSIATNIVFTHASENGIIELINELKEEENEEE